MLRAVSTDDKEEGGIVFGGIGFGMGSSSQPAVEGQRSEADKAEAKAAGPREMGDALLPLRALVVADLVPRGEFNAGTHPPDEAILVEAGLGLDPLFKRLAPRLAIKVESVLQQGAEVRVDFSPTSVKSFRPDQLAAEIPLLRSLLDGRKVLERLREGTGDVDGARVELARLWNGSPLVDRVLGGVAVKGPAPTPAPAPTPTSDESVDRLLDMVDTGTPADATEVAAAPAATSAPAHPSGHKKGRFDTFLAAVAGVGKKGSVNPGEAIALVEKAFGIQLGAIVQHPEFRRLEEAWRGLDLLASRAPKQACRLEVISCGPDEAAAKLQQGIEAGAGVKPPVTFAVVDTAIAGDAADWARLRAIAEVAEQQTVPVLVNGRAGIFGHDDLGDVDRLDNKQALFDAPERAPWRAAVSKSSMLWVSIGINRVLGRAAYDRRTSRIREATVEELPGDEASATVWIEPCWVVASLVLKSFGATGWPHRITGARDGGLAEDLPVREVDTHGSSERIAIPTEVFFSTETQKALSRLGLLALASQPNNDSVYLLSAPTAYVPPPKRTYEGASSGPEEDRFPQAPLVDQLFVARLVQFLRALGGKIAPTEAPEDIKAFLEAALWELFDVAKPGRLELKVDVHREDAGPVAMVTVRPGRFLGVGMEEFSLGVPLG